MLSRLPILFSILVFALAACDTTIESKEPELNVASASVPALRPRNLKTVSAKAQNNAKSTPVSSMGYDKRSAACLAEAMYFEARGTGEKGMRAVGEVILNRAKDRRFPNTICGVVNDRCQFSYTCDGHPEVYREKGQKAIADRLARELLTNRGADITNGALYFHAARLKPGWFASLSRRGKYGGNIFYR